jgi:hypothetical protein
VEANVGHHAALQERVGHLETPLDGALCRYWDDDGSETNSIGEKVQVRIHYLEKIIGDDAEKRQQWEQMHAVRTEHHATLEARLEHFEALPGDTEKHAELEMKLALSSERQMALQERVELCERLLNDTVEMQAMLQTEYETCGEQGLVQQERTEYLEILFGDSEEKRGQ